MCIFCKLLDRKLKLGKHVKTALTVLVHCTNQKACFVETPDAYRRQSILDASPSC